MVKGRDAGFRRRQASQLFLVLIVVWRRPTNRDVLDSRGLPLERDEEKERRLCKVSHDEKRQVGKRGQISTTMVELVSCETILQ